MTRLRNWCSKNKRRTLIYSFAIDVNDLITSSVYRDWSNKYKQSFLLSGKFNSFAFWDTFVYFYDVACHTIHQQEYLHLLQQRVESQRTRQSPENPISTLPWLHHPKTCIHLKFWTVTWTDLTATFRWQLLGRCLCHRIGAGRRWRFAARKTTSRMWRTAYSGDWTTSCKPSRTTMSRWLAASFCPCWCRQLKMRIEHMARGSLAFNN